MSVFAGYIKLKKLIYFICNNNCYNCTAKSLLYYLQVSRKKEKGHEDENSQAGTKQVEGTWL